MAKTPYVRFFWSDWIADTAHLDLMQLGAYMRLLEYVYQHSRPIPGDMERVYRIFNAATQEEKTAIREVLEEFFKQSIENGIPVYRHSRAEREMQWSEAAMDRPAIRDEWAAIRIEIISRDGKKCRYCGTTKGPFHIDHVLPRSRGGSDSHENLVVACAACNMSKGARTPEEWLK